MIAEIFINKFNSVQREKYINIFNNIQENGGDINSFRIIKNIPTELFKEFINDIDPYINKTLVSKLNKKIIGRKRRRFTNGLDYNKLIINKTEEINKLTLEIKYLKLKKQLEEELNKILINHKKILLDFYEINNLIEIVNSGQLNLIDTLM